MNVVLYSEDLNCGPDERDIRKIPYRNYKLVDYHNTKSILKDLTLSVQRKTNAKSIESGGQERPRQEHDVRCNTGQPLVFDPPMGGGRNDEVLDPLTYIKVNTT